MQFAVMLLVNDEKLLSDFSSVIEPMGVRLL